MKSGHALAYALILTACGTKAKEPKLATPLSCPQEHEQLLARLREARRCETVEDCGSGYYLPCPFPCLAVLNLDSAQSHELIAAMEAYGRRCEWCDYKCKPDRTKPIVCEDGICLR